MAVRADKRERRDPIGWVFVVDAELVVSDMDGSVALDKIKELFSLSLELRSMEAVRLVVEVV